MPFLDPILLILLDINPLFFQHFHRFYRKFQKLCQSLILRLLLIFLSMELNLRIHENGRFIFFGKGLVTHFFDSELLPSIQVLKGLLWMLSASFFTLELFFELLFLKFLMLFSHIIVFFDFIMKIMRNFMHFIIQSVFIIFVQIWIGGVLRRRRQNID